MKVFRFDPKLLVGLLAWGLAGGLAAGLAGCAAVPPPGSELRVAFVRGMTGADLGAEQPYLSADERRARASTGVREAAAAGRLGLVRCALAENEVLVRLAVLPEGMAPGEDDVLRLRLGDVQAGLPDQVLGPVMVPRGLSEGSVARNWTGVMGLVPWSGVPLEGAAEPFVEAQYWRVRGRFVVRCLGGG